MSSRHPASIHFSFEGFSARGGITDHHQDGWGIAFFEETGCRLLIDHQSSATSPLAQLVKQYPIKSRNVIAHIRKATQGAIALSNCHPFMRELWGQSWAFVHNGDLKQFTPALDGSYIPIGDTDSERAFCYLLQGLKTRFPTPPASWSELAETVQSLTAHIAAHGVFNFILSNQHVMFAHCTTHLAYVVRQFPFNCAKLVDCDMEIDLSQQNGCDDRMTVIATRPLTCNEEWVAFAPGELKVFLGGLPLTLDLPRSPVKVDAGATPCAGAETAPGWALAT